MTSRNEVTYMQQVSDEKGNGLQRRILAAEVRLSPPPPLFPGPCPHGLYKSK